MKLPSDAVLKRAWIKGEDAYARTHPEWRGMKRTYETSWKMDKLGILTMMQAIARVILESERKEKRRGK